MVADMTTKPSKAETTFEKLTAQVIDAIETNPSDWSKPWRDALGNGIPFNATTTNAYKGGNVWAFLAEGRPGVPAWATYKQWKAAGCQVLKGESSATGIRWVKPRCKGGHPETVRCGACPDYVFPVGFNVFHWSQVEGGATYVERFHTEPPSQYERHEAAERLIRASGADLTHATPGRAFYSPKGDLVNVPDIGEFHTVEGYYATVAHELIHWTGHAKRLNRVGIAEFDNFGSDQYAREELIAELGSVFICAGHLGIDVPVRDDHAAYLAAWLKVLRADPKALWNAASGAEKAASFLIEKVESLVSA